ncbi:MAG: hypothetical protein C0617_00240 [Desulfuromonas sp.]|uniref:PilZ domain-containing protein n=1 Tax=Desulfuromonas sp. TaxID=892 RepID=UPI000CC5FF4B|nr:PilZ domain-containing protein [Desulfuromonas sp.]PLX86675.1 MAG: hypothetical protein C0617_00240 [Desulfuromonas sp.]
MNAYARDPLEDLQHLEDGQKMAIEFAARAGGTMRVACRARPTGLPCFEAEAFPGPLPLESIALDKPCLVTLAGQGSDPPVSARIEEVLDGGRLRLAVLYGGDFPSRRIFFRVETRLFLSFRLITPEGESEPIEVLGGWGDISGGGVYFPSERELAMDQRLRLHIRLPQATVECIGTVVRTGRQHPLFSAAVRIDEITASNLARINAFCHAERRREFSAAG